MKAIKRTVAALLATLMLATSTSFTLAAENYTEKEAVVVGKVNAAGIMQGTDKGFEPSKSLTRAEAAAIIVRMKGISESAVKTAAGTTLFNDVAASHWASGYVNQASNLGIVKGVSAKEFAPDREVTIAEFTTMAVRALGAGTLVDSEGVWPTNYVNFANEEGILDDVNSIYTATATRLQAATIVANTLDTAMWKKVGVKSNGEIEWSNRAGETILANVLKLYEDTVTVNKVSVNDSKVNGYNVNEDFDLSDIKVGLTYHAYFDEDDEIQGLWIEDEDTVEFTAIAKNATSTSLKVKVDGKDEEYDFAASYTITINENTIKTAPSTKYTYADLVKSDYSFGSLYLNEKNEIEAVYVMTYDAYSVVDEVNKTKVVMKNVKGFDSTTGIKYTEEDDEFVLTKDGKAMKYSDLEENDGIAYYTVDIKTSNKKYVGEVLETVEGKVTSIGTGYIKLDGKKYEGTEVSSAYATDDIRVNDEIVAYLDKAGKVIMYRELDREKSSVAIINKIEAVTGRKASTTDYEVVLAYLDGTKSDTLTVNLEDTYDEMIKVSPEKFTGITKLLVADSGAGTVTATVADAAKYSTTFSNGEYAYSYSSKYYHLGELEDVLSALGTTAKESAVRTDICNAMIANVDANSDLNAMVVCYDVSGSTVTFMPVEDEFVPFSLASGSGDDLIVGKKLTYIKATPNYYITEDTRVFNVKSNKESSVKVEEVSVDSLDNMDGIAGWVVGIDDETNEVDYVIFDTTTTVARSSEAEFAFVTEVSRTKYNNKTAYEVEVIFQGGKEATYTWAADEAEDGSEEPVDVVDKMVELSIEGDMITNISIPDTALDDDLNQADSLTSYITYISGNRIDLSTAKDTNAESTAVLADNVLVLKLKDGEYTVKDIDDVLVLDDASDDEYDTITSIATYHDGDEEQVVLIVYAHTSR